MDVHRGPDGVVAAGVAAGAPPALALRDITKRFGRVVALDGASLVVRPGTVHAVLGENGAGKTTLLRAAFGLVRPDAGTIERDGRVVTMRSPRDAIAAGMAFVQQHLSLVGAMTVAENVVLGGRGAYDAARVRERVRTIGDETGMALEPDTRIEALPVGAQQRVEIVKAFAHGATLLILDEPTAALAPSDAQELMARLRGFADRGHAVVLITHKLREALDVADEITVLRRGATVFRGPARDTGESTLVAAMLGSVDAPPNPDRAGARGPCVLRAAEVSVIDERGVASLVDASVDVHAGEIVGVAGLEHSGHRELLRALAGRIAPSRGRVERPAAVGFVPEDRHRDALIGEFTLAENTALAYAGTRRKPWRWTSFARTTQALLTDFDVHATGPKALARALSGGNQQRFVLAREFHVAPNALVAENPSRGLDVRATASVHARLVSARGAGAAIMLYSSDLEELLALADRIVVCFRGTVREVACDAGQIGLALTGALS